MSKSEITRLRLIEREAYNLMSELSFQAQIGKFNPNEAIKARLIAVNNAFGSGLEDKFDESFNEGE